MAADGQEAGQPPRLMLITELPDVRARIPSVFSFSCATPCGGAGTLAGASARSRSFEYLHGFRRVAPSRRKKEKPFGGSRRSAVPCSAHLRQPRNQLEPGRGRHREFLRQPPTPGHLVDAARRTRWRWPRLSRSRQAPGGSHYPSANLPADPQHRSAQLFLGQQPIAKGQQCALRGRKEGRRGRCAALAEVQAQRRGPRTPRSHKLKEPGHIAANPRDTALLPALPKDADLPVWVSKTAL